MRVERVRHRLFDQADRDRRSPHEAHRGTASLSAPPRRSRRRGCVPDGIPRCRPGAARWPRTAPSSTRSVCATTANSRSRLSMRPAGSSTFWRRMASLDLLHGQAEGGGRSRSSHTRMARRRSPNRRASATRRGLRRGLMTRLAKSLISIGACRSEERHPDDRAGVGLGRRSPARRCRRAGAGARATRGRARRPRPKSASALVYGSAPVIWLRSWRLIEDSTSQRPRCLRADPPRRSPETRRSRRWHRGKRVIPGRPARRCWDIRARWAAGTTSGRPAARQRQHGGEHRAADAELGDHRSVPPRATPPRPPSPPRRHTSELARRCLPLARLRPRPPPPVASRRAPMHLHAAPCLRDPIPGRCCPAPAPARPRAPPRRSALGEDQAHACAKTRQAQAPGSGLGRLARSHRLPPLRIDQRIDRLSRGKRSLSITSLTSPPSAGAHAVGRAGQAKSTFSDGDVLEVDHGLASRRAEVAGAHAAVPDAGRQRAGACF